MPQGRSPRLTTAPAMARTVALRSFACLRRTRNVSSTETPRSLAMMPLACSIKTRLSSACLSCSFSRRSSLRADALRTNAARTCGGSPHSVCDSVIATHCATFRTGGGCRTGADPPRRPNTDSSVNVDAPSHLTLAHVLSQVVRAAADPGGATAVCALFQLTLRQSGVASTLDDRRLSRTVLDCIDDVDRSIDQIC